MSKFQTKALVAAIALTLAPAAFSAELIRNSSTPEEYVVALESTGATSASNRTTIILAPIVYNVRNGDNIVLRAQPFTVTVNLAGGLIRTAPTAGAGGTLTANQGAISNIQVASDNKSFSFTLTPTAASVIGTGALFTINQLDLRNIGSTEGAAISAVVELEEPATQTLIDSASGQIASVNQATNLTVTATANTVQVQGTAAIPARTQFVGGPQAQLGDFRLRLNSFTGDPAAIETASTVGTALGLTANDSTDGNFQYAANDQVNYVITTQNAGAFVDTDTSAIAAGVVAIRRSLTCAGATVTSGTNTLDLDATNASRLAGTVTLTADMIADGGFRLCGVVNGETQLVQESSVGVEAQYILANANGRDPAAVQGAATSFTYNGAVVNVYHINPAANAAQQSYIRITNTGATSQIVITGRDDEGKAGASAVQFNLASGKSMLVTSQDLENGNAAKGIAGGFGAGTGKWRITVSAPSVVSGSLKVQNFLRNNTNAGLINTNVNNEN